MKLQEIMIKNVIQAAQEETIAVAAKRMRESAVGCLVITVAGVVKGIITDRDLLACLAQGHDPYQCKLSMHMQRPVHVLRSDEDHVIAADVMRDRRIKRVPIAEKGKLLGIISMSDLAALAAAQAENLRAALSFFTAVVRTQASQNEALKAASLTRRSVASQESNNNDRQFLDSGGPG